MTDVSVGSSVRLKGYSSGVFIEVQQVEPCVVQMLLTATHYYKLECYICMFVTFKETGGNLEA